jgi:hypothetical protein
MVTAKTILSSSGFIKKKVNENTGRHEKQIEKRNMERKAAQGRKEKNIQKKRGAHSLPRMGKRDTGKNGTKKAFVSMMTGTEVARIGERDHQKKSTRRGIPRYHSPCLIVFMSS